MTRVEGMIVVELIVVYRLFAVVVVAVFVVVAVVVAVVVVVKLAWARRCAVWNDIDCVFSDCIWKEMFCDSREIYRVIGEGQDGQETPRPLHP